MNFSTPDICRLLDFNHLGVGIAGCGIPQIPILPTVPTFHLDTHSLVQPAIDTIIKIPEASIPVNPEPANTHLVEFSQSVRDRNEQLHALNPGVCRRGCEEIKNNVYATCGTTNAMTAVLERKPQKMVCLQNEYKKYDACKAGCNVNLPDPTPEVIADIKYRMNNVPPIDLTPNPDTPLNVLE